MLSPLKRVCSHLHALVITIPTWMSTWHTLKSGVLVKVEEDKRDLSDSREYLKEHQYWKDPQVNLT